MRFLSFLLRRFYPLQSGMGTIANTAAFRRLDGNPGGDIVAKVGRFSLVIPQDDYVGRSIKYFGELDKKVTWVIRRTLRPGDTALDIGANLGLMSFKMLECVGETGRVIAFEPQSRMAGYIRQSIAHNRVGNLYLNQMGLADKAATLRLSIPDHNAGAASFATNRGSRTEEVPVTTLDEFAQTHALGRVRLIKVDVEGFEPRVFSGARTFLTTSPPEVIVFEENRKTGGMPESVRILQSYGYTVFTLPKALLRVTLQPYRQEARAQDFVAIHDAAPPTLRGDLGIH